QQVCTHKTQVIKVNICFGVCLDVLKARCILAFNF
ncbi:MAG: hypothetical protein ACI8QQ_003071, partial [Psychroserpens sp.]